MRKRAWGPNTSEDVERLFNPPFGTIDKIVDLTKSLAKAMKYVINRYTTFLDKDIKSVGVLLSQAYRGKRELGVGGVPKEAVEYMQQLVARLGNAINAKGRSSAKLFETEKDKQGLADTMSYIAFGAAKSELLQASNEFGKKGKKALLQAKEVIEKKTKGDPSSGDEKGASVVLTAAEAISKDTASLLTSQILPALLRDNADKMKGKNPQGELSTFALDLGNKIVERLRASANPIDKALLDEYDIADKQSLRFAIGYVLLCYATIAIEDLDNALANRTNAYVNRASRNKSKAPDDVSAKDDLK